jgi:glycine hydroxymethyltransferase
MPAMTTRGVKEEDTKQIVHFMDQAFKNHDNEEKLVQLKEEVKNFALKFPVPGL